MRQRKPMPKWMVWGWAGVALLVAVIAFNGNRDEATTPAAKAAAAPTKAKAWEYSAGDLSYDCEQAVLARLKAPSTARFPGTFEQIEQTTETAAALVWRGHVDAQNGFGAQIRTRFVCRYDRVAKTLSLTLEQ